MTTADLQITDRVREILTQEGPAAFFTSGVNGFHLVATWNSQIQVLSENRLAVPAFRYYKTEENLKHSDRFQMIVASREIRKKYGRGGGYRLSGRIHFETSGAAYDLIKGKFDRARAALVLEVERSEELT
ncbi:MAG: hypothetical protein HYT97_04750 [Elusimicrobia bacterium]|nr:hypothetical protein [Elusimicrobiota bacterium]